MNLTSPRIHHFFRSHPPILIVNGIGDRSSASRIVIVRCNGKWVIIISVVPVDGIVPRRPTLRTLSTRRNAFPRRIFWINPFRADWCHYYFKRQIYFVLRYSIPYKQLSETFMIDTEYYNSIYARIYIVIYMSQRMVRNVGYCYQNH